MDLFTVVIGSDEFIFAEESSNRFRLDGCGRSIDNNDKLSVTKIRNLLDSDNEVKYFYQFESSWM